MPRDQRSIGDLADAVLAHAKREVVKTASAPYHQQVMGTDLGQRVQKVAAQVLAAADDTGVSYADLAEFRRSFGV